MNLIIDTDPGIDDAMAIAYAHAEPEIDIVGVTTIFGNTHVAQSSRNARFFLDLLGVDVPVAEGACLPRNATSYCPSSNVHGPEGFGDLVKIPEIGENLNESAAQYLVRMARETKRDLTICAVGPLTNIADAIQLDSGFVKNVRKLFIMGGAINCPGNITKFAEANIFHDPVAADEVFASGMNIAIVPLDVTLKSILAEDEFEKIARKSPRIGGFLNEISRFYLEFYRREAGLRGCPMHDVSAVIACIHPRLFKTVQIGLRVSQLSPDKGATLRDSDRFPVSVCVDVDGGRAVDLYTDAVSRLD